MIAAARKLGAKLTSQRVPGLLGGTHSGWAGVYAVVAAIGALIAVAFNSLESLIVGGVFIVLGLAGTLFDLVMFTAVLPRRHPRH